MKRGRSKYTTFGPILIVRQYIVIYGLENRTEPCVYARARRLACASIRALDRHRQTDRKIIDRERKEEKETGSVCSTKYSCIVQNIHRHVESMYPRARLTGDRENQRNFDDEAKGWQGRECDQLRANFV